MTQHAMQIRDDAKTGEPLQVTITDETFAYGIELQVRRGKEQANIVLDYFDGQLVVRQYPLQEMEQIASMPVTFEPADDAED